ncbi:hypothetical protein [Cribrihabitans neustonicus]|uniref:hypothetical protein n=1 Tax=Cribrihabitans neustonicus TaxID=1429085 RepID=UPI003B5C6274
MTFVIDALEARTAIGASRASWKRWTRHLPSERTFFGIPKGGGSTFKHYRLGDVVVALRQRRKRGLTGSDLRALVDVVGAPCDPSSYLGDDARERAAEMLAHLSPEEAERFARVKKWAGQGAVYALWGRAHQADLPANLDLLVLRPAVLTYVLAAQRTDDFPTTRDAWGDYVAQHIAAVALPDTIQNITEKGSYYEQ